MNTNFQIHPISVKKQLRSALPPESKSDFQAFHRNMIPTPSTPKTTQRSKQHRAQDSASEQADNSSLVSLISLRLEKAVKPREALVNLTVAFQSQNLRTLLGDDYYVTRSLQKVETVFTRIGTATVLKEFLSSRRLPLQL
ncbi:hypothetical protein IFM89_017478 [Coptis chinensis]|uniref:Uncharacterized protein n=1 Tax=Coptis chinensis TaxID=261450 RepID=A0A835HU98_9MAGN|nr:hypothetical protein IFM89_017478 [Coptis chinensis]